MTLTQIRRTLLIGFISLMLIGLVLLLNITAPNPTHRRYSSEEPISYAGEYQIPDWRAAELILANDLRLPDNNANSEKACLCGRQPANTNTVPNECNVCIGVPEINNYRLPDVISDDLIADSKYYRNSVLRVDGQLQDFVAAANHLDVSLWIYVPHLPDGSIPVTSDAQMLIESTGGGVVAYFSHDAYQDLFDQIGRILLIIGGTGIVVILGWEAISYVYRQIPTEPESDNDAVDDAVDTVDETEDFMRRVERLSRKEIDKKNDDHKKR